MKHYEIRRSLGHANKKNRGWTSGDAMRWFVYDAETEVKMVGFNREACRDGGFKTKKAAEAFITFIGGMVKP